MHGTMNRLIQSSSTAYGRSQVGPAPSHDNVLAMQGAQVLFAMRWDTWDSSKDSEQEAAVPELTFRKRAADEECSNAAKRQRGCAVAAGSSRGGSLQNRAKPQAPHAGGRPAADTAGTGAGAAIAGSSSSDEAETIPARPAGVGGRLQRQTDKDWAALTTWLRMNLHHPRTAKRQILFLGEQDSKGRWSFHLNPALTWADVSDETKVRLKDLVVEVEETFAAKYPRRPSSEWVTKVQKYKPPGTEETINVKLGELINSLQDIFNQNEPQDAAAGPVTGTAPAAAAAPCSLKVQQASEEQQQVTTDSPRSTQEALGEGAVTSAAVSSHTPEARNRRGAFAAANQGTAAAAAAAAGRGGGRGEESCASPSDASGASRADTPEGDMSGGSSQDS